MSLPRVLPWATLMFQRSLLWIAVLAACDSGDGGSTSDAANGGRDAQQPVQFVGEWGRGGWLKASGQFGSTSSLTTTLTGTTVGGTARLDGTAPSPLSGTFDGTLLTGMFMDTDDHTLDLVLKGGFLVGPYGGGSMDAIATFVSDLAPGAPAVIPAMLTGTWKSSKSAAMGTFAVTITGGLPNPSGHITAPGLADDDVIFGYQNNVLQGLANVSQTSVMLFGSGTKWVGSYGLGTDIGVLELTAAP